MFHPKDTSVAKKPPMMLSNKEISSAIRRSQSAGNVQLYVHPRDESGVITSAVAVAASATTTTNSSSSDTSSSCGSASGRLEALATEAVAITTVDTTQRKHTNSVKGIEESESGKITLSSTAHDAVVFRRTVSESATLTAAAAALHVGSSTLVLENGANMDDGAQDESKDAIFPSLPDLVLKQLGLLVKADRETFTELDVENRFISLALAFKTDLLTLNSRLELQKRQRDQAEINMAAEVTRLKAALYHLSRVYIDSDSIELLDEIHAQVTIVQQATDRVSGSAELFGAVQQEHRLSRATEVLVSHVENIKRSLDKMNSELDEVKRVLAENNIVMEDAPDMTDEPAPRTVRYRSLAAITAKKLNSKRRASIAAMPRPLSSSPESTRTLSGIGQSCSTLLESRPRSHMANVVNSMRLKTSMSPIQTLASSTVDICEWPETAQLPMGDIDESSESQKEKVLTSPPPAVADDELNNNRVKESVMLPPPEVEVMKLPRLSITDADNNTKHIVDDLLLETTIWNPIQYIRSGVESIVASSVVTVSTYAQRHRTTILRKMRFYISSVLIAAAAWFVVWAFVAKAEATLSVPVSR